MLSSFNVALSQQLELKVFYKSVYNNSVFNDFKYQSFHKSEALLKNKINTLTDSLIYKGYLNVKLDSLVVNDKIYFAFFNLGKPIKDIDIIYKFNLNTNVLKKYTYIYNDSIFTLEFSYIKPLLNALIDDFEQNGKPFTQLKLSEIAFSDSIATAHLVISNDDKRTLNKIIIKDYENFPKSFLNHYLKLHSGDVFSASKLSTVSKKINYINFVSEIKPSEVLFTNSETNLYLYLKKVQTNSIDGLIGFTSKQTGKGVLFNGYLDLQLENAFNTGESLSLLFKNNGLSQQKFDVGAKLPYIFNTNFSARGSLDIYKQDTTYINVRTDLSLDYPLDFKSGIALSINRESSLNLSSAKILNIETYQSTFLGLQYHFESFTDDILFHEKFHFNSTFFFGTKTVDSIKISQLKIETNASYLWSLNQRNAIYINNSSAFLNTSNYLTNELFRLGGSKSLRGFNENSLLASSYSILNVEYRYRTNLDSYIYTITDFAYLRNVISNQNSSLYSLGFGYKFKAKMGVINLGYALGIVNNKFVTIKNSILNLNITTYF